jgi:hypothetical protein
VVDREQISPVKERRDQLYRKERTPGREMGAIAAVEANERFGQRKGGSLKKKSRRWVHCGLKNQHPRGGRLNKAA